MNEGWLARGLRLTGVSWSVEYVVAAACVGGAVVLLLVENAMCHVFRLAVYRYATGEGGTGPFATADLEAAFKPSPVRRFLRRR